MARGRHVIQIGKATRRLLARRKRRALWAAALLASCGCVLDRNAILPDADGKADAAAQAATAKPDSGADQTELLPEPSLAWSDKTPGAAPAQTAPAQSTGGTIPNALSPAALAPAKIAKRDAAVTAVSLRTAAQPATNERSQDAPTGEPSPLPVPRDDSPGGGPRITDTPPPPAIAATRPTLPAPEATYPIDLSTALRLAEVENPQIAEARSLILQAMALQQQARAIMLPTLNAGTMYHGHTGNLQRSSGRILALSEQSLYFGGGTRTLAAESLSIPAVNIVSPMADAIFEPLVARQRLSGAQFRSFATTNSVLLEVAVAHQDLLATEASLRMRLLTEEQAANVARLTASYANTGEGRQSDANRAAAELRHRQLERQQAEEHLAVASAQLSRRLHLDPAVRLQSLETALQPISLVDLNANTEDLVRVALQQRPEMGARAAEIGEASMRYTQERTRPFLPLLWAGYSGGAFGGGSNLVPPFLGNFGGRTDFDVRAIWTLQNFGLGNLGIQRTRLAQVGEASAEQARTIARVRREVAAAQARAKAHYQQIEIARRQLATAEDGYREDYLRVFTRSHRALPIELVNSLDLLGHARQELVQAIFEYNRAQFELFVALGAPPPLASPPNTPLPPAPIAPPPLPPLGDVHPPHHTYPLPVAGDMAPPAGEGNPPTLAAAPVRDANEPSSGTAAADAKTNVK